MGVLKEYTCLAHGDFESAEENPLCSAGCDTVERRFRTPPGLGSARTKNIDVTLQSLAKSHNLTDLGPAAMRRKALAAEKSQAAYREFCERRFGGLGWGNTPTGGTMNVQTKEIKGSGPGAASAVAAVGGVTAGTVADVKASLPSHLTMPRPVLVKKDPDNLTVKDAKAA